jgi:hypothetical protein
MCAHSLDSNVFDIIYAPCNHEDYEDQRASVIHQGMYMPVFFSHILVS